MKFERSLEINDDSALLMPIDNGMPTKEEKEGKPIAMPKTFTFDPRNFIHGPFRICPKCDHEKFGVVSIRRSMYTRRCRDCGHSLDFRLPELRKRLSTSISS